MAGIKKKGLCYIVTQIIFCIIVATFGCSYNFFLIMACNKKVARQGGSAGSIMPKKGTKTKMRQGGGVGSKMKKKGVKK